jgi:hypothetical protein
MNHESVSWLHKKTEEEQTEVVFVDSLLAELAPDKRDQVAGAESATCRCPFASCDAESGGGAVVTPEGQRAK